MDHICHSEEFKAISISKLPEISLPDLHVFMSCLNGQSSHISSLCAKDGSSTEWTKGVGFICFHLSTSWKVVTGFEDGLAESASSLMWKLLEAGWCRLRKANFLHQSCKCVTQNLLLQVPPFASFALTHCRRSMVCKDMLPARQKSSECTRPLKKRKVKKVKKTNQQALEAEFFSPLGLSESYKSESSSWYIAAPRSVRTEIFFLKSNSNFRASSRPDSDVFDRYLIGEFGHLLPQSVTPRAKFEALHRHFVRGSQQTKAGRKDIQTFHVYSDMYIPLYILYTSCLTIDWRIPKVKSCKHSETARMSIRDFVRLCLLFKELQQKQDSNIPFICPSRQSFCWHRWSSSMETKRWKEKSAASWKKFRCIRGDGADVQTWEKPSRCFNFSFEP